MSKRACALILAAMVAAMNLAGMTAVAHAQTNDQPARPPTQGQVGESWHQRQVTAEQPNIASDARRPPTERQVGESWRHGQVASSKQTAADAALQRQLARERHAIPNGTPAKVTAPAPDEPSGTSGWLVASLGVLTAALALAGGLAVLAAKRAGRKARFGPAA